MSSVSGLERSASDGIGETTPVLSFTIEVVDNAALQGMAIASHMQTMFSSTACLVRGTVSSAATSLT